MPREKHEKQLNDLQSRHLAVLKKFGKLDPADVIFWRHPGLTTPVQLRLLKSLVGQLEASFAAAHVAAQNVNQGLKVVIEANPQAR